MYHCLPEFQGLVWNKGGSRRTKSTQQAAEFSPVWGMNSLPVEFSRFSPSRHVGSEFTELPTLSLLMQGYLILGNTWYGSDRCKQHCLAPISQELPVAHAAVNILVSKKASKVYVSVWCCLVHRPLVVPSRCVTIICGT
eukprot:TRINITY_DN67696_c2_g1_i1.p1 TRINITY_DN67696_c2_g1~~TRINITY_DN67696_c2_g1_i1.p1  ORF type:complete len:139 (+),score=6.90 TRINITY_DN67696_c2_g1_i1:254-670(+)